MIVDASALTEGQTLQADVVIMGGGVAGISLAMKLARTRVSVLLLEGGGFEPTERSQSLYAMDFVTRYSGLPREAVYATRERLRYFGGTSNHWSGWCRPLESHDFEERSWVPDSGWPISFEDLRPWYEEAQPLLKLRDFDEQVGAARGRDEGLVFPLPTADFESRTFHFSASPRRFGPAFKKTLESASRVRILVEANVLRMHANEGGDTVTHADVKLEAGPQIRVEARGFVLATGGLENPRVLLLSDETKPGAFDRSGLVGRYFMEHPHDSSAGWLVFVEGEAPGPLERIYMKRPRSPGHPMRRMNVWMTSRAAQERERMLGVTLQIKALADGELNSLGEAVRDTAAALHGFTEARGAERTLAAMVWTRCENAPNRDSRVYLTDKRDRLGLRTGAIDWKLTEFEAHSVRRSFALWAQAFGATGRGRACLHVLPKKPFEAVWGGAHHMGTTRMSADPKRGVVDANCKMHGLSNLWVAGSSVYPTSGVANPTFTLTALALRLADHLATVFE